MSRLMQSVIVISLMILPGIPSKEDCPEQCDCTNGTTLHVNCQITNFTSLHLPQNTRTLDLSNNNLTRVPSQLLAGVLELSSLLLSSNKITEVHGKAFRDLKNLTFLNLSHNAIQVWDAAPSDFKSLIEIDITSSPTWLPEKLVNITSLQMIHGVTWSNSCVNCNLKKHSLPLPPKETLANCNQAAMFYSLRFYPKCSNDECKMKCHSDGPQYDEVAKKTSSRRFLAYIAGYVIGGMAICANLVVLVNIFLSKALQRDLSMSLVSNMAVCDIMIGLYSIIISKHTIYGMALNADWSENTTVDQGWPFCRVATVLMTTGEMVSVVASLLLTVEKYTCIVYCMNPSVRLRKNHVIIIMTTIWVASLLFSLSPLYGFVKLKYSPSLLCTMPSNRDDADPTFIIYPCALIFYNYLLMIPMYMHIFVVVRRSSTQMSIHRNAALAKKVLIMIGSNFVFFAVPMSLLVVYVVRYKGHETTSLDEKVEHFVIYELLPVILLALNSFLNPFLYAFRYRKFQIEFKSRMRGMFGGGHLRVQLRRALSAITTTNISLSSPTTKTGGYKFDNPLDYDESKRQSMKRLHVANVESAIALRGVTANNSRAAHDNDVVERYL